MGISNIFDPIVQAHYGDKGSAGGGSGGTSGSPTDFFYTYEVGKEYETLDMNGAIFYKISDVPFDTAEFDMAIVIIPMTAEDGTDALFFNYKGGNLALYDMSEEGIPGLFVADLVIGNQPAMSLYSCVTDINHEFLTIPKGVWLTSGGTQIGVCHFIFHKK